MNRYETFDLLKLAFTVMISVFHLWAIYGENALGGFIAVEFFFIVSGFFLALQEEHLGGKRSPLQYTWIRIKKLYPHYFFSFFLLFLFRNLLSHSSPIIFVKKLLKSVSEIFILYGTILSDEKTFIYNSQTWYLSVMLLVGYLLWAFMKVNKPLVLVAAPVFVFWIYAYMAYTLGTTNNWRTHVFETLNYATLRAFAGMLLGILVYQASRYLSSLLSRMKDGVARFCFMCGGTIIVIAFIASYRWFHRASFLYIACFAIGLTFIAAGETRGAGLKRMVLPLWINGISYAIYLNHYLVILVIKNLFSPAYHAGILIPYLMILIAYSAGTNFLMRKADTAFQSGYSSLIGKLLKAEK